MVHEKMVNIIVPVKDSLQSAEQTIRAILDSGYTLTVYDDYSQPENAQTLDKWAQTLGFAVIHLSSLTNHPSPNYRTTLIDAQTRALQEGRHLLIIESDVVIRKETIPHMLHAVTDGIGMIAAVTHDEQGRVNFPYEYAKRLHDDVACSKRLSFCCTLLTCELLQAYDFARLDPTKNWFDVHISHMSIKLGLTNILQVTNPVLHTPHSSRPWKQLKYTHPLLYYWRKLTQHRDKI